MFKPVASIDVRSAVNRPEGETAPTVNRLFMFLHGYYGQLFVSKFATGERDEAGKDKGIKSARAVWSVELREFDAETVMQAARRCKESHPEFPPSLPQFVALCRAAQPRRAFVPVVASSRIGMSEELRTKTSKRIREESLSAIRAKLNADAGVLDVPCGLAGINQLIAHAIGLAGGDEGKALMQLESA